MKKLEHNNKGNKVLGTHIQNIDTFFVSEEIFLLDKNVPDDFKEVKNNNFLLSKVDNSNINKIVEITVVFIQEDSNILDIQNIQEILDNGFSGLSSSIRIYYVSNRKNPNLF